MTTWASQEFKTIVKDEFQRKLPLWMIILIAVMMISASALFLFIYFLGVPLLKTIITGAVLCITILLYIISTIISRKNSTDYITTIRDTNMKNINDRMNSKKLPLAIVGEKIRADIENELQQIEAEKAQAINSTKKLWTALIVVPCGFLLALLFQGIFSAEMLASTENLDSALSLFGEIFVVLFITWLIAAAINISFNEFYRYYRTSDLSFCLTVLNEIEIIDLYESSEKELIPAQKS
ncbi:MAG: hypothetical protein UCO57_09215 [Gemmiger sp.]|uniref:hypothetical protein n=1 Tax=Gemmiger sp. TaxID=2049027 RepID=UPI002E7712F9|nr:hypothetical protein [Gemmiger sp.]MEE0708942.1 hypothetical protein [Gemmiger sp.]